jgi:hypothetical protein
MAWGKCRGGGVIIATMILPCFAACEKQSPRTIATEAQCERGLIFGTPRETMMATQIARSDWPAAANGYHSPQETVFVEYYRDYYGNGYYNWNSPQTDFYSYRVGSSVTPPPP